MKKIMFILAFVGIGLFASADNGKVGVIKLPIKKEVKNLKKQTLLSEWKYSFTCGGHTYTGCCWSTQAGAQAAGYAAIDDICP